MSDTSVSRALSQLRFPPFPMLWCNVFSSRISLSNRGIATHFRNPSLPPKKHGLVQQRKLGLGAHSVEVTAENNPTQNGLRSILFFYRMDLGRRP
jgi:hypothetical protein